MTERAIEVGSIMAGLLVAALGGWTLLAVTSAEPQVVESAPVVIIAEPTASLQETSSLEPIAVNGVSESVSELLATRGFAERIDLTGELPDTVLDVLERNDAVLRIAEETK